MNRWILFGFVEGLIFSSAFGSCGLNWTLPVNHFENVNPQGKLSYWQKIGEIEVGDDFKLPIHLNFRGDRYLESAGLGVTGFMLGITDSSIVALDERRFLMQTPAGRYRTFRRDRENPNILRSSSKWAGEIKGDMITVATDCGDKLIFRQGAITRLQVKERIFDFIRSGSRVTEIREGGRPLATLRENRLTGAVELVKRNGEVIAFEIGRRPVVHALAGSPTPVVGGFAPTVAKIVQPGGQETSFEFGTNNKELLPTLGVNNGEHGQRRTIAWNPANGQMIKDSEWTYDINPAENPRHNAAIGRKNAKNQSEFWHRDGAKGEEIVQGVDGVKKVTSWFMSGKLAGKLRKTEEIANGESRLLYQASYDEKGNLFRELLENGETNQIGYSEDGSPATKTRFAKTGELKSTVEYVNGGRVTIARSSDGRTIEYHYDEQGRESKMIINGDLHSETSYGPNRSWEKVVVYDQKTGERTRTFFKELDDRGRALTERITEHIGDYPEIYREFFYNPAGQLVKKLDSQQGAVEYLDGPDGKRIARLLE